MSDVLQFPIGESGGETCPAASSVDFLTIIAAEVSRQIEQNRKVLRAVESGDIEACVALRDALRAMPCSRS